MSEPPADPTPSQSSLPPTAATEIKVADLLATVAGGDRRQSLEAIRDRVASELAVAEGRDVAPLARELRAVIAELDGMPVEDQEVSPVANLTARIAARKQAAAGL